MIDAPHLAALLGQGRFDLTREVETHNGMEQFLIARLPAGCPLLREFILGPGERLDFLVDDRIAVEVKVKGAQRRRIYRQLERYARHERVEALVLCTNVSMGLPETIGGKPAYYVSLGRAWL